MLFGREEKNCDCVQIDPGSGQGPMSSHKNSRRNRSMLIHLDLGNSGDLLMHYIAVTSL